MPLFSPQSMVRKREKSIKSIFEGFYFNLRRKFWKFSVDSRYIEYPKIRPPFKPLLKTFQKSNYLTGPFCAKSFKVYIR